MKSQRGILLCVVLSVVGLGLTGYLTAIHLALLRGQLIGGAVCSGGGLFNCHAVALSPFGTFLTIPLSLWGVLGYLATLSLAVIAWQFPDSSSQAVGGLVALSAVFVALDVVLLLLMVTQVQYLCLLCLFTYGVNLALLVASKQTAGRSFSTLVQQVPDALRALRPTSRAAMAWIFWGTVGTGLLGSWGLAASATFLTQGPGDLRAQMTQFVQQQQRVTVDVQGDPVHGPATGASLQIVEFSDFLCRSCQQAAKYHPLILAGRRKHAAFIFKHFPLDSTCNDTISRMVHPRACEVAVATECAHLQGKFWEFHDLVLAAAPHYNPNTIEDDAARLGLDLAAFRQCRESGQGVEAVKRDIAEAGRLGVTSTPTYVINGVRMAGVLNPVTFDEFVAALHQDTNR